MNEEISLSRPNDPQVTFSVRFAGEYEVKLTASNCIGSSSVKNTLIVTDAPVEDFVVGAAVSLAGANETQWETDFRFYNPCGEPLDCAHRVRARRHQQHRSATHVP